MPNSFSEGFARGQGIVNRGIAAQQAGQEQLNKGMTGVDLGQLIPGTEGDAVKQATAFKEAASRAGSRGDVDRYVKLLGISTELSTLERNAILEKTKKESQQALGLFYRFQDYTAERDESGNPKYTRDDAFARARTDMGIPPAVTLDKMFGKIAESEITLKALEKREEKAASLEARRQEKQDEVRMKYETKDPGWFDFVDAIATEKGKASRYDLSSAELLDAKKRWAVEKGKASGGGRGDAAREKKLKEMRETIAARELLKSKSKEDIEKAAFLGQGKSYLDLEKLAKKPFKSTDPDYIELMKEVEKEQPAVEEKDDWKKYIKNRGK